MNGPAKSRLHDYEAGWPTLRVQMGVATEKRANDVMCRVAQQVIDELEERRRAERERRRKHDEQ